MLRGLLNWVRETYHPMVRLRQSRLYPFLLRFFDRPVYRRLPGQDFQVCLKLVRDFPWVLQHCETVDFQLRLFQRVIDLFQPQVFIDIGANIGFYSWVFLSRQGKDARVLQFEPDPENVRLLRKTIPKNPGPQGLSFPSW